MVDLIELKRQVSLLDESVFKLGHLLDPAYGGAIGELIRLLQEQETRDATAATRLAELEKEALRWYQPDGTFVVLSTPEEVVARRWTAARRMKALEDMLRRALHQIEPTNETAIEVRRAGFRLLNAGDDTHPGGCYVAASGAPHAPGNGSCQGDGHHLCKSCANHEGKDNQ